MRLLDLWKISRFRLTFFYGAIFSVGVMLLLGLVYWQTAGFMGRQMDQVIRAQARSLNQVSAEALPLRIREEIQRDVRHINLYGLFAADGTFIVGNVRTLPSDLKLGGAPRQLSPRDGLPAGSHVLAERLPWGEVLVVGRDATQLGQIREIILHALFWSGAVIVVLGLLVGAALSVQPLHHITAIQAASRRIMDGDLTARLPVVPKSGELDMLAGIVNAMLDEVQRLVGEVKSASDSLAHDLRTPLTRLRALLYRIEQDGGLPEPQARMLAQAIGETDTLLGRFRALLRVSEIESRERRAGFAPVELGRIVQQIGELFEPVAAERDIELSVLADEPAVVQADGELMFEAVSNLVDNAVKFTPAGGRVEVRLTRQPEGPRIEVRDTGPGVPDDERASVLRRFYRSARDQARPGSGLGLSIVAAIVGLHDFSLELDDARPGLSIAINCWPRRMRP